MPASAELRRMARKEWPIVFVLMIVASAVWAFIELADEVVEGSTAALDEALLLALRDPADVTQPLGPAWIEEMMRDFTGLGGTGVLTLITLAVSGYLLLRRKHKAALAVLVAVGIGILISTLIKMGFDRSRPDLVPHGSYVYTASFPSGHSMMSAVVYLTLAVMLARIQAQWRVKIYVLICAIVLTVLVGFSRVYLGVHWPSDVLAGWSVGAAWALACWLGTLLLQRRGRIEPEEDGAGGGE